MGTTGAAPDDWVGRPDGSRLLTTGAPSSRLRRLAIRDLSQTARGPRQLEEAWGRLEPPQTTGSGAQTARGFRRLGHPRVVCAAYSHLGPVPDSSRA